MHNAEAAIEPAFYDHQDDSVQQDRVAADWGADEVFASVPRRRIRGDHHGTAARRAVPTRRVSGPAIEADDEAAERAAWLAEVEAELLADDTPAVSAPVEVPQTEELTDGVDFDAPAAWSESPAEPGGRRTVTITGNPGRALAPTRPLVTDRRRPPRTIDERIGHRPDRIAGMSFGMGILLIVVAAFS
jgi:hypothetical protein